MRTRHPFIVIHPAMPTNTTGEFLVVHVDEWVAVSLGEKEGYVFTSKQPDYASAEAERTRLNHQPAELLRCPAVAGETPEKSGVSLVRSAATPEPPRRRALTIKEG